MQPGSDRRTVPRPPPARSRSPGPFLEELAELAAIAPVDAAEAFRDLPGLVLLESARPGRRARWSYLAADPLDVLMAPAEEADPFAGARRLLARLGADGDGEIAGVRGAPPFGGGLAGFVGYDVGRRLERLPELAAMDQVLPALRLGLYDWVIAWDRREGRAWLSIRAADGEAARVLRRRDEVLDRVADLLAGRIVRWEAGGRVSGSAGRGAKPGPRPPGGDPKPALPDHAPPTTFVSNLDRPAYEGMVEVVREAIAAGELYQANVARRLEAPFAGDPWPLYRRLRTGDPAPFAAFLDLGPDPEGGAPRALLSASPEPFLAVDPAGRVSTDPIKGTRPRGATPEEDRALAAELLASAKDRAENTMIVDVLRNDLGRVCRPGTVRVPRLCRLERTTAVQHLVSTITGELLPGRDAFHLLAAAFPGGSITGAPKIRAMELIEALEPVRRGPYCGTIAWFGPDGATGSSIVIRTFVADGARLTLHVGGGITWRSDPAAEWDETCAKACGPLTALGAVEAEDPTAGPASHREEARDVLRR